MSVIIAADIGGTNCRLGLFRDTEKGVEMERARWVPTPDVTDSEKFIQLLEDEFDLKDAAAVVAAIAGPVEENVRGHLSNGVLSLDFGKPHTKHAHLRFSLINDFMAQAYAIISPLAQMSRHLTGPNVATIPQTRAVIGAGTGLGQAVVTRSSHGGWLPAPSENGHANFPFVNADEQAFHAYLCHRLNIPFATGDHVVTGNGLALLHQFLTAENLTPAEVGAKALSSDTETLKWYSRFYARACRNWMLSTLCRGGLWIAGGIAAKNPYCMANEYFYEELYGHPAWKDFLKSIPVFLIEDINSGLWGAACFGQLALEEERTIIN